jgi:hypothetical protein
LRPDVSGAILPGIDPRSTPGVEDRDAAEDEMSRIGDRLDELQERLDPQLPRPELDVQGLKARLRPPN